MERATEKELIQSTNIFIAAVESWICGLLSILLLFEAAVGVLLIVIDLDTASFHLTRWISLPLLAVVVVINAALIARIWDTLSIHRYPMPIFVADRYMPMSGSGRALYTLAWALYSAMGLASAFDMAAALDRSMAAGLELLPSCGLAIICYGMSSLANMFVVLFLAALTGRLSASQTFWKHRVWMDLSISGILLVFAILRH